MYSKELENRINEPTNRLLSQHKVIVSSIESLIKNTSVLKEQSVQWEKLVSGYSDVIFKMGDTEHLIKLAERDLTQMIKEIKSLQSVSTVNNRSSDKPLVETKSYPVIADGNKPVEKEEQTEDKTIIQEKAEDNKLPEDSSATTLTTPTDPVRKPPQNISDLFSDL